MVFVDVVYNDVVKVHILSRFLYLISEKKPIIDYIAFDFVEKINNTERFVHVCMDIDMLLIYLIRKILYSHD